MGRRPRRASPARRPVPRRSIRGTGSRREGPIPLLLRRSVRLHPKPGDAGGRGSRSWVRRRHVARVAPAVGRRRSGPLRSHAGARARTSPRPSIRVCGHRATAGLGHVRLRHREQRRGVRHRRPRVLPQPGARRGAVHTGDRRLLQLRLGAVLEARRANRLLFVSWPRRYSRRRQPRAQGQVGADVRGRRDDVREDARRDP